MLTLIPTPIDEVHKLEATALDILRNITADSKSIICVEEEKVARRRWIRWGLDREMIENFVLFNEHTSKNLADELIAKMQKGHKVYLMSDCGLPAFCDPGQILVEKCHERNIKVTATPFYNSVILAMALSGFNSDKFVFEGFVEKEKGKRIQDLKRIMNEKRVSILMDTPYRLNKLIDEMKSIDNRREVFLARDLNKPEEELLRDKLKNINIEKQKREFILILGPKS